MRVRQPQIVVFGLVELDRDVENLELDNACRNSNLYNLALLLAEQSLGDRSTNGEFALTKISLVLRYDGIYNLALVVVV